jgi:FAD:protein FMN transferase
MDWNQMDQEQIVREHMEMCERVNIRWHVFFLVRYLPVVFLMLHPEILQAQEMKRFLYQSTQMGSPVTIQVYASADSEAEVKAASQAAFRKIEDLNHIMSDYLPDSELNRLSAASGSGEAVKVSEPLFTVLRESVRISEMSDGAFDVTIGLLTRAWRTARRMPEPELPPEGELREMLGRTGSRYILMDEINRTVQLMIEGMRLDLGGIAKGYAMHQALIVLGDLGFQKVLVDMGGDIALGEPPPGREYWEVAVPVKSPGGNFSVIKLKLSGKTVATSGDMFQFIEAGGIRYSHILDPETGVGTTRRNQATVISNCGMKSDALASALTVMKPEEGIDLIESLEDTEAVIFIQSDQGVEQRTSSGFSRFMNN